MPFKSELNILTCLLAKLGVRIWTNIAEFVSMENLHTELLTLQCEDGSAEKSCEIQNLQQNLHCFVWV